jgi:predicted short-subunit dehydrogenase-like oxidoreductase (DUF2520 family)
MTTVSIIGAGRLGTALGSALHRKGGYRILALTCRTQASSEASRLIIGQGTPLTDNRRAASEAGMVFITVPDDIIPRVVDELASSVRDWTGVTCLHCSGLLSSHALAPLARKGASCASFHPMQSFAGKKADPKSFSGIFMGLEGDPNALDKARTVSRDLGARPVILAAEDKPLYHTASSIASNLLVPLLHHANLLLRETGFPENEELQALLPLVEGTLQNVKKFDTKGALTGPLARGDEKSITLQMEALAGFPATLRIYREMSIAALEMALTEGTIDPETCSRLRALLEGK